MKDQPTGPFLDLSRLALKSAIHQPVTLLLTMLAVTGSALVPLLQLTSFGEHGKIARDGGMAFHLVLGTLLASHVGSSAIRKDVESGLVSSILSKPVSPTRYFLAVYAGVVAFMLLFSIPATIATLLGERIAECYETSVHTYVIDTTVGTALLLLPLLACTIAAIRNRFFKAPFVAAAFTWLTVGTIALLILAGWIDRTGTIAPFDLRIDTRILYSSALITVALVMMSAVAITLSTRLRTASTLVCMTAILFSGLLWDYFFAGRENLSMTLRLASHLLPNWQNFWMPDTLDAGGRIPTFYLGCAIGYAAVYSTAVLVVGATLFRRNESA